MKNIKKFFGIFKTNPKERIKRIEHFKRIRNEMSKDFEERLKRITQFFILFPSSS